MSRIFRPTLLLLALLPLASPASTMPFINEIHYDNTGTDSGEGVELAGAAGTVLDGWTLELYNGSAGTVYDSIALSGTISDQADGFGTVFFSADAMQNGAPDGVALVNGEGSVLQFLSYEGAFTATAGAAAGLVSQDIGVFEAPDTPLGWSLQLIGLGVAYEDFTWAMPAASSYGEINPGQSFAVVPLPATLPLLACALAGALLRRRQPGA